MDTTKDAQTLVSQYLASKDSSEDSHNRAAELAELLSTNQLKLLVFIQLLGPSLTSENGNIRSKATACLGDTLRGVETNKLNKHDINVLLEFLLAKLDDDPSLAAAFESIGILSTFDGFQPQASGENVTKVLKAVLEKYEPRKHLAKVRKEVFDLLSKIFRKHQIFLSIDDRFELLTKAFIHIASGEKDPRNLLLSFEINASINKTFEFSPESKPQQMLVSELFDVSFCYFPISFTPTPNDPYGITADKLKFELQKTLSSQSLFADEVFPGLLEKLTSVNPTVRCNVLDTLLSCVSEYNPEVILQFWHTIWNAMKFEILHNEVPVSASTPYFVPSELSTELDNVPERIQFLVLDIIKNLAISLSKSDNFPLFLATVTEELNPNLKDIKKNKLQQSVLIICHIATASTNAFDSVVLYLFSYEMWGRFIGTEEKVDDMLPENDKKLKENSMEIDYTLDVTNQRDLVDALGYVLSAYGIVGKSADEEFFSKNQLAAAKDHLLIFFGQLLQQSTVLEKTLKCKVVQQLVKLLKLPKLINDQERALIVGYFTNQIDISSLYEREWTKDVVFKEILQGLVSSMQTNSNIVSLVIKDVIPHFIIDIEMIGQNYNPKKLDQLLSCLRQLCVSYQILEIYSVKFLNIISSLRKSSDSATSIRIFNDIILFLTECINKTEASSQFLLNSWFKTFIPRLGSLIGSFILQENYVVQVESCGALFGLIIKFIDKSKHQEMLNTFTGAFLFGKGDFVDHFPKVLLPPNPQIEIFNNILSNIDKSTSISTPVGALVQNLSDVLYAIDDDYLRLCFLQSICLLTNKFADADSLKEMKNHMSGLLKTDGATTISLRRTEVFVWLTKGLLMRLDENGIANLFDILELLNSDNLKDKETAMGSLDILFIDLPLFSNNTAGFKGGLISHVASLNVRLLYKQRAFQLLLPKIIEQYSKTRDECYLLAMSSILKNLSSKSLKPHIGEILPLILSSLLLKNSKALQAAVSTLNIIVLGSPNLILPHLGTVIPKLLDISAHQLYLDCKSVYGSGLKLLALQCLLDIVQGVEVNQLVKYKKTAISELSLGLDDRKRQVRKLTSDVRQAWYELGR